MKQMRESSAKPKNWLSGTECWRHVDQEKARMVRTYADREYWLLKHCGHGGNINTSGGPKYAYCPTRWALLDLQNVTRGWRGIEYGAGAIKEWEGRWSRKKEEAMIRAINEHLTKDSKA